MAFVIFCPGCGIRLTLGDDRAGGAVDCPKCSMVIGIPTVLPAPTPVPVPPTPLPVPARSGPVPPAPTPPPSIPPESGKAECLRWFRILLAIGGGSFLMGVATSFLWPELGIVFCMLGIIGAGAGFGLLSYQKRSVCPFCQEWEAVKRTGKDVLERKKCFGIVIRRASSTSAGAIYGGSKLGTMPTYSHHEEEREERVPVIRTTTAHHYRCRYCLTEWTEERVKEVEDFEPDEPLPLTGP